MDERWLPIPGYEGVYSVSDHGRVRRDARRTSGRAGHILAGFVSNGYAQVVLYKGGRAKHHLIHRLVMAAFAGPPPPDRPFVNHIDCDRTHNHLGNLEYVSHRANVDHALAMGRFPTAEASRQRALATTPRGDDHYARREPGRLARGERVNTAKLTAEKVLAIRQAFDGGQTNISALAREFGVSRANIRLIVRRESWTHI